MKMMRVLLPIYVSIALGVAQEPQPSAIHIKIAYVSPLILTGLPLRITDIMEAGNGQRSIATFTRISGNVHPPKMVTWLTEFLENVRGGESRDLGENFDVRIAYVFHVGQKQPIYLCADSFKRFEWLNAEHPPPSGDDVTKLLSLLPAYQMQDYCDFNSEDASKLNDSQ